VRKKEERREGRKRGKEEESGGGGRLPPFYTFHSTLTLLTKGQDKRGGKKEGKGGGEGERGGANYFVSLSNCLRISLSTRETVPKRGRGGGEGGERKEGKEISALFLSLSLYVSYFLELGAQYRSQEKGEEKKGKGGKKKKEEKGRKKRHAFSRR